MAVTKFRTIKQKLMDERQMPNYRSVYTFELKISKVLKTGHYTSELNILKVKFLFAQNTVSD